MGNLLSGYIWLLRLSPYHEAIFSLPYYSEPILPYSVGVGVLGLGSEKNLLGEKNQKKIWDRGGKIA